MTPLVQQRIDELSTRLGRSVVLNDPDIRLLVASKHFGDEDQVRVRAVLHRDAGSAPIGYLLSHGIARWSRADWVPPSAEHDLLGRLVAPVRHEGVLLGFIVVIDDRSLSPDEVALVEALARDVGALVVAERHAADERAQRLERLVLGWSGTDPDARAEAVAGLREIGALPADRRLRVLAIEVAALPGAEQDQVDLALRHALDAAAAPPRTTRRTAVVARRATCVVASPTTLSDQAAGGFAERLLAEVDAFSGGSFEVRIGIGPGVDDLESVWISARRARLACRAVPVLGGARTVLWERLGPLDTLLRIPAEELDPTVVPDELERLVAADPQGRLLETLAAFLAHGGSGGSTSDALSVHRTTLYYRLDRIREITGLDLDDGEVRVRLHVGMLVRRLLDARAAGH
ncbi:PucR family transcriptional regulator [Nocardioides zeae]